MGAPHRARKGVVSVPEETLSVT
ncbi:protein of unknown function [Micropruina glycogenica]|uniref:Uncharacterized protein n=1 Tax=Micropruina glycogenica TaxID=75385 RepID=A0A2N9JAQ0_9ACTN|nr:protein of unknown function [Micropruina glycogenica]